MHGRPMSKWHKLVLGNLLFAVLPAVFAALAVPAALLAAALEPSSAGLTPTGPEYPGLVRDLESSTWVPVPSEVTSIGV